MFILDVFGEVSPVKKEEKETSETHTTRECPCNVCGAIFNTYKDLDSHKWEEHNISPQCDKCGKSFKNRRDLSTHKKKCKGNKREIPCNICGTFFFTYKDFDDHNWEVHQMTPQCNGCGKSFKNRRVISAHKPKCNGRKKGKELPCTVCGLIFGRYTEFDAHNYEFHQMRPSCDICGKEFDQRKVIWKHRQTHKEKPILEKILPCEVCGKKFATTGILKEHITMVHSDKRPYLCLICGIGFKSSGKLKLHEMIHTGEKPYACEICSKRFRMKQVMINHMRSHTGERPFSCETCGNSYKQRSDLTIHKRTHTGEKPFSCELCEKSFYSSSELTKHKKTCSHLNMIKTPKIDEDSEPMN